jgi:pimeloyl-ACP methyl ester carboxylesterase
LAATAHADLTQLEIRSRTDVLGGRSPGLAGPYETIEAALHFTVNPRDAHNRLVVDIDKAPRDGEGRVVFTADPAEAYLLTEDVPAILKRAREHWEYATGSGPRTQAGAEANRAQAVTGTTSRGLYYEVTGAGQPVVFIHAFSVDRRMWEPQIAAFADRFRLVRYDLRGHGRSVAPTEPYTGYDDLRNLLDELRIEKATLVGLSAGSELAISFAIAHPERVAGLVLAAPGLGGYQTPPLPWARPVFEAAAAGEPERAARLWADTPIMALRGNLAATSTVTSLVMNNSRLWTFKRTEQPLSPPAAGRLSEITCPALIIVGDEDLPHIRDIAGALQRGIAGARLVTVPRAGHIVNLDATEAFNDAVAAFLAVR